jgi:hypothetical protein
VPHQLAIRTLPPRRMTVAIALCLALLAATLAAVSGTSPAVAGENTGLCTPDHSRFTIPSDFVLPACFDGSHLIIHNDTDFPLTIKMSGDVGTPSLRAGGDLAASIVEQYSVNEGDLMPDYRMSLPIGSGAVTIAVQGSTSNRTYLLVRTLLGVLPVDVIQSFSTAQALVGELNNDWQKYENCRNSPPGFFGSLGCDAIYYRDVAFALGRAGVQFGASAVVGAVLNLLQTAQWADAAPDELKGLRGGDRTLAIPAATDSAPVATQPAANPPAQQTQTAGAGTGTPAPATAAPARTVTEQEGSHGANTFQDVANASGEGPKIPAMAYVQVTCKVLPASTIGSAYPDGYWYLIASPPWGNQYYAVANTFWNGDVPGHLPYTHNEDPNVPDC